MLLCMWRSQPHMVNPKLHLSNSKLLALCLNLHFRVKHSVEINRCVLNFIRENDRGTLLENEPLKEMFDDAMGNC